MIKSGVINVNGGQYGVRGGCMTGSVLSMAIAMVFIFLFYWAMKLSKQNPDYELYSDISGWIFLAWLLIANVIICVGRMTGIDIK